VNHEDDTRARAQAYGLLSRLVLVGLDEQSLGLVRRLVPLAEALPVVAEGDELAAAHHALFSLQVFPYESVYCDASGQPGGRVSEAVADLYRRIGFGLKLADVTADHLGVELGALSFLSSAEADARRDGVDEAVARCREATGELLESHLGPWLAPFSAAVAAAPRSFWTTVVELVVELVAQHATELGVDADGQAPSIGDEGFLDAPDTGLKDIAARLCSPVESGALLTRGDIERIGRALAIPTGFGSRAQRVQVLLESAAQYDGFRELCRALDDELEGRGAHMAGLPPVLAASWSGRLEATQVMLRRLASSSDFELS